MMSAKIMVRLTKGVLQRLLAFHDEGSRSEAGRGHKRRQTRGKDGPIDLVQEEVIQVGRDELSRSRNLHQAHLTPDFVDVAKVGACR